MQFFNKLLGIRKAELGLPGSRGASRSALVRTYIARSSDVQWAQRVALSATAERQ